MKRLVLAALLLAIAPAAARGQIVAAAPPSQEPGSAQALDNLRSGYRVHAGPFYFNPTVLLKNLGIDTNVFNQSGLDQPQSDFTFTLTPQSDVALPIARRGLLKGTVGADVVYYKKFASERSVNPLFTLRGEAYANHVTFFAQESYLNTRDRPSYEIDLRTRHLENDFGAGASLRVTPKLSVTGTGLLSTTRYRQDAVYLGTSLQQTLTSNSRGYSVTGREKLTPLTTLSLAFDDRHDHFPYSTGKDADTYSVMPGVDFKPRALVSGSAFVGYRHFQPVDSTVAAYSGLVSHLTLAYTLLGATMFGVMYDRDVAYSFQVADPYYVDNSPGLFLRRQIAGHVDAIGNVAWHHYRYLPPPGQASATTTQDTSSTITYGANLGYRLRRDTRVGLGFSYSRRTSDTAVAPYSGLQIGTTVTYGISQ